MLFVRLAGCNVGKYEENHSKICVSEPALKLYQDKKHSICTTVFGREFLCDTDYHKAESLSEDALVRLLAREEHVCVTGGEPFLYNLTPLILVFQEAGVTVHIETSGTKPIAFPPDSDPDFPRRGEIDNSRLWITCSPKTGFLPDTFNRIDEIKLLLGTQTTRHAIEHFLGQVPVRLRDRVYIQPINDVDSAIESNVDMCLKVLRDFPALKLSAQLHKYLHQR